MVINIKVLNFKFILVFLFFGGPIAHSKELPLEFKYTSISKNAAFEENVQKSLVQVLDFSIKNKLGIKYPSEFIKSAILYGTKKSFDEMMHLSGWPQNQAVPENYVGVGQNQVIHVVSWQVYKEIHPNDSPQDYQKLITHELTHLFHVAYLKGQDDQMGPRWFYEGLACLVAIQYEGSVLPSKDTIQKILKDDNYGDYKAYAALLREIIKSRSVPALLKEAKKSGFNKEVEKIIFP